MRNYTYPVNLAKVCRLCFSEKINLYPIFDNSNVPDLSVKIKECVSIEVSSNDETPNQICDDCFKEVVNWITFKQKCATADSNLKDYIQNLLVKEESGEEIENIAAESCSPYIQTIYVISDELKESKFLNTSEDENKKVEFKSKEEVIPAVSRKFSHYYRPQLYICQICSKSFTRACDFINHDNVDHPNIPRTVNCNICGKLMISEDRLHLHKKKFHAEKVHPCEICQKKFVSFKSLIRHLKVHNQKLICDYCKSSFRSKNTLQSHIMRHMFKKSFGCNDCGKCFSSKSGLNTHQRTHSLVKLFKCDKCDFAAKHQSGIYIHTLSRHGKWESVVCELCGKAFKNKLRLNEHQKRKHETPKRFACDKCGNSFKQMYQLRGHYRTHTGEKPYICEMCGRGFSRSDGLKEHKRVHEGTEEKPYCEHCGKEFSRKYGSKEHKCTNIE